MTKPLRIFIGAMLVTASSTSHAQADAPSTVLKTESWQYAIGVKRGDGMANSPGIDAALVVHPWVVLGIAGFYLPERYGRGFAIAPSVQFRTSDIPGKLVGFASLGVKYLRREFGTRSGSGSGGFGAIGLEWTFMNGLSLRGGIGFHEQASVKSQDGNISISQPSYNGFFLESGLRYFF